MLESIESDSIASAIGAAIAPVFLLAGVGAIMNVIATRLARAVDRRRLLAGTARADGIDLDPETFREVGDLDRRIVLASQATFFCVASALAVCVVVTMMVLAQITQIELGVPIALGFMAAMVLVACGLVTFLIEVRIAIKSLWPRVPRSQSAD